MGLATLLERFAGCERRVLELYRRFAELFAADPEAARLWVELSNAEAAHFAVLRLAVDTLRPVDAGGFPDPAPDESLEGTEGTLTALEARAASGTLTPAEAVEAAVALEQEELPRIQRILRALPPPARGSVLGGIVLGLPAHYACLAKLAERGGVPRVGAALEALQEEARQLAATARGGRMKEERRRAVRHPVPGRVEGTVTAEIATALVDVSATGALVEHLHMMRPGYLYRVRFVAPDSAVDLTCRAVRSFIVRAEPQGAEDAELVYRTGLEFIEPDAGAINWLLAVTQG